MRVRLRHVSLRRSGTKAVREQVIDVGRVRIGRAADSDIHLTGLTIALEHAFIERREDRAWIETSGGEAMLVGGHVTSGRGIGPGDVVRIGHYELRLLEPAADEDLVVEVEALATRESAEAVPRSHLRVTDGLPSARLLSWIGAALVLMFVAVPVGLELMHNRRTETAEGVAAGEVRRAAENAREVAAGRDSALARTLLAMWNPGPIAQVHGHIADRCTTCHADAFRRVGDAACVECHRAVGAHASPELAFSGFDQERCGECHADHRGTHALVSFADGLCTSCHRDLHAHVSSTSLEDVGSFANAHPEFRPAVVVEVGEPRRERIALSGPERSGLNFPHSKHLAPRVRTPMGEVTLGCADCHLPDRAGAAMEPVHFADNCQRCHSLAFDESHPERQAPHANPAAVRQAVTEFYAAVALAGRATDPLAPAVARRRPGRELTEEERLGALRWAETRAAQATSDLLGNAGPCQECHAISRATEEPVVAPVNVVPFAGAARWMPLAKFSHEPHSSVTCDRCHPARDAVSSEAVLLPGIETCRECHGQEQASGGKVASPCLLCHDFHHANHGPMRPNLQTTSARASTK